MDKTTRIIIGVALLIIGIVLQGLHTTLMKRYKDEDDNFNSEYLCYLCAYISGFCYYMAILIPMG